VRIKILIFVAMMGMLLVQRAILQLVQLEPQNLRALTLMIPTVESESDAEFEPEPVRVLPHIRLGEEIV